MFWYNLDFIIFGSLKYMCIVVIILFYLYIKKKKKKRWTYFEGWETQKSYCTAIKGNEGSWNFFFDGICIKGHQGSSRHSKW